MRNKEGSRLGLCFARSIQVIADGALYGPIQSKLYSKYQLSSGSIKSPFVPPLELVTEPHLEKDKLQELTFVEVEEKPGKIS